MELEIRECEVRTVNEEERTVSGLAVPYGQVTNVSGYKERIERGAFANVSENVQLFYGHDHRTGGMPIGRIIEAREEDEGLVIKAQLSKTAKADEVYTLLRDGVLNKFSVGFIPTKSKNEDGVVVRQQGDLKEVSIVAIPAYSTAAVSEVRADFNNTKENEVIMNEVTDNAPEVSELRDAVSDLERKFAMLSEQGNTNEVQESQFRNGGEWLSALAKGDEAAKLEVRAFTGLTVSDSATRPAWVAQQLKLVEQKRPVLNLFGKAPLPATGMSYVYPKVVAETGTVGKQTVEGNDLPYLEVTLGTGTATIEVYGGYTSISKQAIQRTEPALLEVNLRHLYNQYAKATESAVRTALVGASGVQVSKLGLANNAAGAGVAHGAATAKQWIANVFESAALIEDNSKGAQAEFIAVSRDVFLSLATLVDSSGRPLFVINGDGINSIGNVNVRGVSGNIGGFPVVVAPALPANSMFVTSSEALTVREDATKSLQDENIINLTEDFSVYGYLSVDLSNPLAIVKVDVDGIV